MPLAFGSLFPSDQALDPQAPMCGQCGYCVHGTPGMICPECGADLRKTGVVPASRRLSFANKLMMTAFVVAIVPGAIFLSKLMLDTVVPFTVSQEISRRIVCASPLNDTVQIISGHRLWQPPIMTHHTMTPEKFILTTAQHEFLEVNLKTGQCSYLTDKTPVPQWKTGAGFSVALLAEWLGERGNNSMDPRVQDFAEAVHSAVTEMAKGNTSVASVPLLDHNGAPLGTVGPTVLWTSGPGHTDLHPAAIAIVIAPWLLLGIYGSLKIRHRWQTRNRTLSEYHQAWLATKTSDIAVGLQSPVKMPDRAAAVHG
jgi:hypothetical protein